MANRSVDERISGAIGLLCELMQKDGMEADRLQAFELALGKLVGSERLENAARLVKEVRRLGVVGVAGRRGLGRHAVYRRRSKALAKLSR